MNPSSPLPSVEELVGPPSFKERLLWRISALGWPVAHLMQRRRFRPGIERVKRELLARPAIMADAWGPDPRRREFAHFLRQVLAREGGWPNDRFIPDDPLETLWRLGGGGPTNAAVSLALGDRLCRPVPTREWEWLAGLTLGQAVDVLFPQVPPLCPTCHYDLTGNTSGVCPECGSPLGTV